MEIRIGIKKTTWEQQKKMEGYAIIDGVKKDLNEDTIKEMQEAKAAGKIKSYTRFWLNENGNPLESA